MLTLKAWVLAALVLAAGLVGAGLDRVLMPRSKAGAGGVDDGPSLACADGRALEDAARARYHSRPTTDTGSNKSY